MSIWKPFGIQEGCGGPEGCGCQSVKLVDQMWVVVESALLSDMHINGLLITSAG